MVGSTRKIETKERNNKMRYIKPQILATSKAASAIRGTEKAKSMTPDNHAEPFLVTIAAYQADE